MGKREEVPLRLDEETNTYVMPPETAHWGDWEVVARRIDKRGNR